MRGQSQSLAWGQGWGGRQCHPALSVCAASWRRTPRSGVGGCGGCARNRPGFRACSWGVDPGVRAALCPPRTASCVSLLRATPSTARPGGVVWTLLSLSLAPPPGDALGAPTGVATPWRAEPAGRSPATPTAWALPHSRMGAASPLGTAPHPACAASSQPPICRTPTPHCRSRGLWAGHWCNGCWDVSGGGSCGATAKDYGMLGGVRGSCKGLWDVGTVAEDHGIVGVAAKGRMLGASFKGLLDVGLLQRIMG